MTFDWRDLSAGVIGGAIVGLLVGCTLAAPRSYSDDGIPPCVDMAAPDGGEDGAFCPHLRVDWWADRYEAAEARAEKCEAAR